LIPKAIQCNIKSDICYERVESESAAYSNHRVRKGEVKRKVGKGENRRGALRKISGKLIVCRECENKSPLTSHEGRENVRTDRAY
jgi:hypothetical protein